MCPQEHLEEGHGRGLERGEGEGAALARLLEAGEREEGARDEAEGGDDRVGVDERQEDVPAQEVRPPVGLRVPGEDEGEVGEEERPGDERDREGGSAQPGGQRSQRERQREGPECHVEAGERVPGVGAGPAEGGGADEVRAEVIAEGEAGDARDLGRVADHELAREAHVERGVGRHERVEEEVAGVVEAVPAVLGEREQGHEGETEGQQASERGESARRQGPRRRRSVAARRTWARGKSHGRSAARLSQ